MFRSLVRAAVSRSEQLGLALKSTRLQHSPAGRALVDAALWPSDVVKVMTMSRDKLGAYPALWRPRTLNDHLQRHKLVNRDPRLTRLADKLAVRDYVAETVGPAYLNTLDWAGTDLAHAPFATLPSAFVIKTNQGSGTNLIVRDATTLDVPKAVRSTRKWLAHDHSRWAAEWEYRWIPPKILIERLLLDNGKVPRDFKCWCFNGGVRFVRVDLYDLDGPLFGEMTFHPSAGYEPFTPDIWNHTLGSWLS